MGCGHVPGGSLTPVLTVAASTEFAVTMSTMDGLCYNTIEEQTLIDLHRHLHPSVQATLSAKSRESDARAISDFGERPNDAIAKEPPPTEGEIQSISRPKKAIAACTGAFTTSILSTLFLVQLESSMSTADFISCLVTPFDVVKTRLQIQTQNTSHSLSSSSPPQSLSSSSVQPLRDQTVQSAVPSNTPYRPHNFSAEMSSCSSSKAPVDFSPSKQRSARASGTGLIPPASSHPSHSSQPRSPSSVHMKLAPTCAIESNQLTSRPSNAYRYPSPYSLTQEVPSRRPFRSLPKLKPGWLQQMSNECVRFGTEAFTSRHPQSSAVTFERPPHLTGMVDGFLQVGRREGVRGLWRGLTPTILMTVPSQVTYMVFYDFFKEQISARYQMGTTSDPVPRVSPHQPSAALTAEQLASSLISGASARSISATLVTPLELVRTRLQAVHGDSHGGMRSNLQQLAQEARAKPSSLWRGLGPTLYRDVPFSAIYFTAYESLKRALTGGSGLGERRVSPGAAHSHSSEFAVAFIAGASAGCLAAILTHPFDLIKTRRQALADVDAAKASHVAGNAASRSTLTLVGDVYRTEGVRGLFRGLSPRIAKVGPACGVMIGSFEVVGRLLDA